MVGCMTCRVGCFRIRPVGQLLGHPSTWAAINSYLEWRWCGLLILSWWHRPMRAHACWLVRVFRCYPLSLLIEPLLLDSWPTPQDFSFWQRPGGKAFVVFSACCVQECNFAFSTCAGRTLIGPFGPSGLQLEPYSLGLQCSWTTHNNTYL